MTSTAKVTFMRPSTGWYLLSSATPFPRLYQSLLGLVRLWSLVITMQVLDPCY